MKQAAAPATRIPTHGPQYALEQRLEPARAAGTLCSQCAGRPQALHGDDETPAEFVSELGRLRDESADRSRSSA